MKHLTRLELIEISEDVTDSNEHVHNCAECRAIVQLFRQFPFSEAVRLLDAPHYMQQRAIAIVSNKEQTSKQLSSVQLIFDSWAQPNPVGVRSVGLSNERRLRYATQFGNLDIRAEQKKQGGWDFIAKFDQPQTHLTRLVVNGKDANPDDSGYFSWSSTYPPRKLALKSEHVTSQLPPISWTRRKQQPR